MTKGSDYSSASHDAVQKNVQFTIQAATTS